MEIAFIILGALTFPVGVFIWACWDMDRIFNEAMNGEL